MTQTEHLQDHRWAGLIMVNKERVHSQHKKPTNK